MTLTSGAEGPVSRSGDDDDSHIVVLTHLGQSGHDLLPGLERHGVHLVGAVQG